MLSGRTSYESGHGSVVFQDPSRLIVLTTRKNYDTKGAYLAQSIPQAIKIADKLHFEELAVLGGEKIYEQLLDWVDTLYITEIHEFFEGDTFFPEIRPEDWEEVDRQDFNADAENPYDYSFVTYKRTRPTNVHHTKAKG